MQGTLRAWTLIAFVALLTVAGTCYYRAVIWPHENLRKVFEDPEASNSERREACHRLIAWNKSHDAYIFLESVGDETSVPLLIRSLDRVPVEERKAGVVECTWGHCREALVAITGEDFGYDVEKWREWYRGQ